MKAWKDNKLEKNIVDKEKKIGDRTGGLVSYSSKRENKKYRRKRITSDTIWEKFSELEHDFQVKGAHWQSRIVNKNRLTAK